jgi:hypothetical protein
MERKYSGFTTPPSEMTPACYGSTRLLDEANRSAPVLPERTQSGSGPGAVSVALMASSLG